MKNLRYILTLVLTLAAGTSAFGQIDLGGLLDGIGDPQNWYFINLTAKNSTTSGGSGQVRLMTISMDSSRIYDQFMGVDIPADMQYAAWPNGNPQPFAPQVTQLGFSPVYMPGVEADILGMTLSSYAYYAAWAKADDGSYFDGWSFTDGATNLGMAGAESDWGKDDWTDEQWYDYCVQNGLYGSEEHWDNDKFTWVKDQIYRNDKLTPEESFLYVKLLPLEVPGYILDPITYTISGYTNYTLYATFRPVQVVDYTSYMGEVIANPDEQGWCSIEIQVAGKNIDNDDFNEPTVEGADWAIGAWEYDTEAGVVFVDLVYTAPSGIQVGTEYKTTMTFSSKGGSSITAPVTIRSVAEDRDEATLKIGDTEQSGDWAAMLAAANAATGTPVVLTLNKDIKKVTATQIISNTMTFNLNGYVLQSSSVTPLQINSGVVTIPYSKYMGAVNGNGQQTIVVAGGELTLEGGDINGSIAVQNGAKLTVNGAMVWGEINNAGTTIIKNGICNSVQTDYAVRSTGNLTIDGGTIQANTAVYVEAGIAKINKGHIEGTDIAVLSKGNTTIEKLAELISGAGTALTVQGGTTTVNCGKFDAPTPLARTAGTLHLVSGFFKTQNLGIAMPAGKTWWDVMAGTEYAAGYTAFIGDIAAAQTAGVSICTIGSTSYSSLEEALAYANNNLAEQVTIVLRNNYTLPAGNYTLPANAMLLIPYEQGQEVGYPMLTRIAKNSAQRIDYIRPFEYRRLTLAAGANLDVFGTIEVSGRQFASDEAYAAIPYAGYGQIEMSAGSHMTILDGATLRVWGYMTGAGDTDVRRGGTVREQFQMGDWKGGTTSMGMLSDDRHVFPLTQYYIQSIESPVKYHPGAVLSTATAVSAALGGLPIVATANDIKIVGVEGRDDAMFLMNEMDDAENTWVRKWYDVDNDIQTYEVNSSAHVGSMVLDLGSIAGMPLQMHSGWFNLPITNNMKIHLLSGYMDFTQSTELLPGAEVEVDKESTVAIVTTEGIVSGALYVYDAEDWDTYAYDGDGSTLTKAVKYSPSWFERNGNGTPTARDLNNLNDATINVHGTFDTYDGDIFCSEHGANIFSTNADAGTFTFTIEAMYDGFVEYVYQVKGRNNYEDKPFYPAQLKNANGQTPAYANTAGTEAGKSYCYMNGRWTLMSVDEDDARFMVDNYGDYYAKPNEYVAVTATKENRGTVYDPWYEFVGNDDHTFSGKYEQDRLFILMGDQWWEVTAKDNLYYSADNDKYYYYDETLQPGSTVAVGWQEKRFTITWKNWDGSVITTYDVPYGTMAEYRSTNPTREADVDYTYDFTGWTPTLNTVTGDVTYTATYSAKQRRYTVIFQTEGGAEIERHFLVRDEMPVCENEPVKTGHILRWSPAIAAVTGDAVYTATWLEEKPATYAITFVNYNGTTLWSGEVNAGEMPAAPATPTKPATSEYTYVFNGWKPALEAAERDLTYTAQFREQQKTYTISFVDENGASLGAAQQLTYGAAPVVPNYTKPATAQYTYTITWTPQVTAVVGNQTYRAVVTPTTNRYSITCVGEGCQFTGIGVYEYGTQVTLTVSAQSGYTNAQWEDGTTAAKTITVTGDMQLSASATAVAPVISALLVDANGTEDLNGAFNEYTSLTLRSNGYDQSADLRGAENISVRGKANFEIQMAIAPKTWYAIATPWEVSTNGGIQTLSGTALRLDEDIRIVYYNGAIRAQQGAVDACWQFVSAGETLVPGRLYMCYTTRAISGLRLQKKAGAAICNSDLHVEQHPATTGQAADANWNGIANPTTFHALLSMGAIHFQRFNGVGYDTYQMAGHEFIVGEPMFVQAHATESVVVNAGTSLSAPMRSRAEQTSAHYEIRLLTGGEISDRIYLQTEEDKADEYVIVKDLQKMGGNTHKAQLWVNRYGTQLCVNTVAEDETVTYPLGISAPANGAYTISVNENDNENEDVNVYLTYNGEAIANLSQADYTLTLSAGETEGYGIRIVRRSPEITTALDEALADAANDVRKVLVDGQVYILRSGKAYTVSGQKAK